MEAKNQSQVDQEAAEVENAYENQRIIQLEVERARRRAESQHRLDITIGAPTVADYILDFAVRCKALEGLRGLIPPGDAARIRGCYSDCRQRGASTAEMDRVIAKVLSPAHRVQIFGR